VTNCGDTNCLDRGVKIVDLSHPLTSGMPVFPGDPEVTIAPAATLDADGFRVLGVHMGSHSGTHIDAPSHFLPEGDTIDQVTLAQFFAPAVVVSLTEAGANELIGADVFSDVDLTGKIVLLHTGWDRFWGDDRYAEHPFLSEDAACILRDAGVLAVAIDAFSVDPTHLTDHDFPAHQVLLGAGIPIAENLRGIEQVTWAEPMVSLLPLRIEGGDGAPIRAVAWQGDS
jgi:arylformamidase